MRFAAVGDVHGHMDAMVRLVREADARAGGVGVAFVLQVGDFEPHRDAADLATMAAPAKYRTLGDFARYADGRSRFPWPIWFIGGNHEPYGFLDRLNAPCEVAPGCTWLGRVGSANVHGLRVGGLSGIHDAAGAWPLRPPIEAIETTKKKAWIHFTEDEVEAALSLAPLDVLLLHEWPIGVIDPADAAAFANRRRSLRYDGVGNEPTALLIELLKPRLVLAGHMHVAYRSRPTLGGHTFDFRALADVASGEAAVALFDLDDGAVREVRG